MFSRKPVEADSGWIFCEADQMIGHCLMDQRRCWMLRLTDRQPNRASPVEARPWRGSSRSRSNGIRLPGDRSEFTGHHGSRLPRGLGREHRRHGLRQVRAVFAPRRSALHSAMMASVYDLAWPRRQNHQHWQTLVAVIIDHAVRDAGWVTNISPCDNCTERPSRRKRPRLRRPGRPVHVSVRMQRVTGRVRRH